LLEVLRDPELGKRLAKDAVDKVKHIYNWKIIAARTEEVYDKVLSESNQLGQDVVASHRKSQSPSLKQRYNQKNDKQTSKFESQA